MARWAAVLDAMGRDFELFLDIWTAAWPR